MRKNVVILMLVSAFVIIAVAAQSATVDDGNGTVITVGSTGAVTNLTINGSSVLNTSQFCGFSVEDMNTSQKVNMTGSITSSAGQIVITATNSTLNISLSATLTSQSGYIGIHAAVTDLTGTQRAVQAHFSLVMASQAWDWCQDLNSTTTGLSKNHTYQFIGGYGSGQNQSLYPFGAVTYGGTGVALGWPMSNPRFFNESFTYSSSGLYTLDIYPTLGLSTCTPQFPSSASFDVCLFSFNGASYFRGALSKYYSIYPSSFQCRTNQQGIWSLWVGQGFESYATDMGLKFMEAQFEDNEISLISRDQQYGYLSMEYTESWNTWHPLPIGFATNNPGTYTINTTGWAYETAVNVNALKSQISLDLTDNSTADNYPGTTRSQVAQMILNSAIWTDSSGDWMVYNYSTGDFSSPNSSDTRDGWDKADLILNSDMSLPHPNRSDIEWNDAIIYASKPRGDPRR